MHINIFIENYLPGGLERFCWDLINGLPAEFDITLLANPIAGVADRVAAAIQRPIDFQPYRVDTATRLDYEWRQANRLGGSMLLWRAFKAVTRWPLRVRGRAQLRSVLRQQPADMLHIITGGYL
ncbi:MAG: hypothetical protein KA765_09660, partial [Thermoflexales bacterium]|nr:hypothetical protein [Thermoflexales bacterium]